MLNRWMTALLLLGLLMALPFACRNTNDSALPEPVALSPPSSPQPGLPAGDPPDSSGLPPSHPPLTSGPGPQATTNRPLPAGTRNPMEDIMAFKARLEKNPNDLEALASLANANMMISRFDAAQGLYERAIAVTPKDLNLRTNLAIAYQYGGKPEQALSALKKNLDIDPNHDATLYNLGFLYNSDQQNPAEARAV